MATLDTSKIIVGEFQLTGPNTVDVTAVCKKWNHLWSISQWTDPERPSYSLIKMAKRYTEARSLKTEITKEQAEEIIKKKKLNRYDSDTFRYGTTWKY